MGDLPLGSIGVPEENSSGRGFQSVERVRFVDLLGEEVRLGKHNGRKLWVVGLINSSAHVCCLYQRSKLLEKALVVTEVVRVNFKVVSNPWQAGRPRGITNFVTINRNSNRPWG